MTLTVLFDNYAGAAGLETAWGYACLVEGLQQTILFDTGGDGAMLLRNMDKLSIAPADIDVVVLSHEHGDHTGGLRAVLVANPKVTVYVPQSFSSALKQQMVDAGADLIEVSAPLEIVPGATLTGEVGSAIREQALALAGSQGLVVLTGCAHPGIVAMVNAAKQATGLEPDLVMGGFHLGASSGVEIDRIVAELQALGVRRAVPSHCSGDLARGRFVAAFGTVGVPVGAGMRLALLP